MFSHPIPTASVNDSLGQSAGYLDSLAGLSALNFGRRHPASVAAVRDQLDRLPSPAAFGNDRLDPFCTALAGLVDRDRGYTV